LIFTVQCFSTEKYEDISVHQEYHTTRIFLGTDL
jgi:hypothetical protein